MSDNRAVNIQKELSAKQQELLATRRAMTGLVPSPDEKRIALRRAYKKLALKYHPDKGLNFLPGLATKENFQALENAFRDLESGREGKGREGNGQGDELKRSTVPETHFTQLSYSALFFALIRRVFISVFGEERLSNRVYEEAFYNDKVSHVITKRKLLNPFKWALFLAELLTALLWLFLYSLIKIAVEELGTYGSVLVVIALIVFSSYLLPFDFLTLLGAVTLVTGVLRVICSPINHGWLPATEFIEAHPGWSLLLGALMLATGFAALSFLTAGAVPAFFSFMAPAMAMTAQALTSLSSFLLPVLPWIGLIMCSLGLGVGITAIPFIKTDLEVYRLLVNWGALPFSLIGVLLTSPFTLVSIGAQVSLIITVLFLEEMIRFFLIFSEKPDMAENGDYTEISHDLYNTPDGAKVIPEKVRDHASFHLFNFFGISPNNVAAAEPATTESGALIVVQQPAPDGPEVR